MTKWEYKYELFIAIGYAKMNLIRQKFMNEAKSKGYSLLSYISTNAQYWKNLKIGENVFIFECNNIQPFVTIGDGTILWSGNHIGHHSVIHDHNFISSHVVVSGHCVINSNSFIGVNSTLGHQVELGKENIIGAGSIITKSTGFGEVYVPARSLKLEKTSSEIKL
jgi:sugar O-acyltransferase (sialic acid O-acetyltransferase NeuD family)